MPGPSHSLLKKIHGYALKSCFTCDPKIKVLDINNLDRRFQLSLFFRYLLCTSDS